MPKGVVGTGEIDQITVVTDGLAEFEPIALGGPLRDRGGVERFGLPLLLVLGENLDRLHAELLGFEKGVVHTAGDGEVGAEHALL